MKKVSIISLSLLSISLVACGKESEFKKAINTKISQQPECLNVSSSVDYASGVNQDEFNKFKEKTQDSIVVSQQFDKNGKNMDWSAEQVKNKLIKLDALTSAGLLTKTTESLPTNDWNKKPNGGYYTFTIYSLTDAGKQTAATVAVSSMSKAFFGDNGHRIFCYAYPEVNKIENFTEGDGIGGIHYAEVKYSYTYTKVADWTNNPTIKSAFPEIAKDLDNPDKTSKMDLIKTNNGWSTDL